MSFLGNIKSTVSSTYRKAHETLTPTLKESQYIEKGVLTPEEFVAAGDLLVYKCPTWTWESAKENPVSYLPPDKQYLRTRNVPCPHRMKQFEGESTGLEETMVSVAGDGDADEADWCVPTYDVAQSRSKGNEAATTTTTTEAVNASEDSEDDSDDDIPDMDEYEDLEEDDPAALPARGGAPAGTNSAGNGAEAGDDNIIHTRTYDLCITYDKYYQTPRIWLFGYTESSAPLTPEQIFEDVSADHALKTVTFEAFPFDSAAQWAYIHPCKHSAVMKNIVARQVEGGRETRVDQYLFVFLKFISAVIPTIEYDFTMEITT